MARGGATQKDAKVGVCSDVEVLEDEIKHRAQKQKDEVCDTSGIRLSQYLTLHELTVKCYNINWVDRKQRQE